MGGLKINRLPGRQQSQGDSMGVILKQRTWETAEGRAVVDGHEDAQFLVGPAGATVRDDKAVSLGLKDGALPKGAQAKPPEPHKTEPRSAVQDAAKAKAPPLAGDERTVKIKETMRDMAAEAKADPAAETALLTAAGKPDANVLSSRAGTAVKAAERDKLWDEVEYEDALADEVKDSADNE